MVVKTFVSGPFETNSYLVIDENSREAMIVDAPPGLSDLVLDEIQKDKLNVRYIVNTHGHIDHVYDNELLKTRLKAKLLIHKDDEFWLNPPQEILDYLPIDLIPSFADDYLKEGDIIKVGNMHFSIIHTPGHTAGGICLYEADKKIIFSGDTIFKGTIGRTDLLGGSIEVLIDSIKNKIFKLPGDVLVYPGHDETTTIKEERDSNPYFN